MSEPDPSLEERAEQAIAGLEMELEGPCCPGPAYHDAGAEVIRDLLAALRTLREQRDELRAESANWRADATGHMFRCAKVNGKWSCAEGCAMPRAESAEREVAALIDALKTLGCVYYDEQDGVAPGWRNELAERLQAEVDALKTAAQEGSR